MSERESGSTGRDGTFDRRMRGHRPLGTGTVVLACASILFLGVLAGGILGHVAAPAVAAGPAPQHLNLTVAYDPYSGLDQYFPANFTVPANVPIIITITNYDNGTNTVAPSFGQVRGTLGNTETVTNASASGAVIGALPADQVSHTFTIEDSPYDINVPVPAAQGESPTAVTFTIVFTSVGVFAWHCKAPCDMVSMVTPGFMTGTVNVVSS